MPLIKCSNDNMKSAYSTSLGGATNCKPLDEKDSSLLLSRYLEKLKIAVFRLCSKLLHVFVRTKNFLL